MVKPVNMKSKTKKIKNKLTEKFHIQLILRFIMLLLGA
ncbi:hypothetical protein FM107_01975 [Sphingobacterium sp. JB170]|nr:hypothetical protein FM107_01975 [Sphingobacterium sp. JB170]